MFFTRVLHGESNTGQASPRTRIQRTFQSQEAVQPQRNQTIRQPDTPAQKAKYSYKLYFTRVYRVGVWVGFVRFALLLAAVLCLGDRCSDSWVFLGLLCLLREGHIFSCENFAPKIEPVKPQHGDALIRRCTRVGLGLRGCFMF